MATFNKRTCALNQGQTNLQYYLVNGGDVLVELWAPLRELGRLEGKLLSYQLVDAGPGVGGEEGRERGGRGAGRGGTRPTQGEVSTRRLWLCHVCSLTSTSAGCPLATQ